MPHQGNRSMQSKEPEYTVRSSPCLAAQTEHNATSMTDDTAVDEEITGSNECSTDGDAILTVLDSTVRREPSSTGIAKAKEDYERRLLSFRVSSYYAKPACLSPLVCARLGYVRSGCRGGQGTASRWKEHDEKAPFTAIPFCSRSVPFQEYNDVSSSKAGYPNVSYGISRHRPTSYNSANTHHFFLSPVSIGGAMLTLISFVVSAARRLWLWKSLLGCRLKPWTTSVQPIDSNYSVATVSTVILDFWRSNSCGRRNSTDLSFQLPSLRCYRNGL